MTEQDQLEARLVTLQRELAKTTRAAEDASRSEEDEVRKLGLAILRLTGEVENAEIELFAIEEQLKDAREELRRAH